MGVIARIWRGLWSLVGLAAGLVGIPAVLLRVPGWPFPRHRPTTADWQLWADHPVTLSSVVDGAACLLWLMWAWLLLATVWDIARRVPAVARTGRAVARRFPRLARVLARIPVPRPFRQLAAGLVGATVIAVTSSAARATPPPSPPVAVATVPAPPDAATSIHATLASTGPQKLTLVTGAQRYTYTVRHGDTLWDIAGAWLGDHERWPEIYHLNKGRHWAEVGGTLTNPNTIYPGWVLDLPADATPPPGAAPAGPPTPTSPPVPTTPAPTPPAADSPNDSNAPVSPPTAAIAPPDASAVPAPHAPPSQTSASPADSSDTPAGRPATGVDLPGGGWVAAPVAAAVAAAAALIWVQRRRRYRPRRPTGSHRTDADLTPMPRTIAALHAGRLAATAEHDGELLEPEVEEALVVTPAVLGMHLDHPVHLADLPPHGVGLIGPGAHAAARGVLTAVLSSGGPWAADVEASLVTTSEDLSVLLDAETAGQYPGQRLHIFPDIDQALADLERHLLYRARLADQPPTDPGSTEDQEVAPMPPLVLLTQAPQSPGGARLAAILAVGARLGITGVLLGAWAQGETWQVNQDGSTRPEDFTGSSGPWLNLLDVAATHDVLDVLREARPDSTDQPAEPTPTVARIPTQPAVPQRPDSQTPDQRQPEVTPASPTGPQLATKPDQGTGTVEHSAVRLHIHVLGRPTLEVRNEQTTTDLRVRRGDGIQLLVYLAVNPDGASSDELMAALWPEVRPRYSRRRFHTVNSELRQHLDAAIGAEVIRRVGDRYQLDPQYVDVDLWQMNSAVDRAATALDPGRHTEALREITRLYVGALAEGHSWLWLAPYRETARRHVMDAYTRLAETESDPPIALNIIEQAIRHDPYNEDLYQRAMRLHAALRSTEGVRHTMRTLAERLGQLEVPPSPQTQDLAADLLAKIDARNRRGSEV